jgi:hypothetical protein
MRRLVLIAVLTLAFIAAAPTNSSANIGVLVLEPIKALGFLTRAGHSAVYLSNICPDGSPVRLRFCRDGEHGGVISKYTPISENGDYDWAIVPFDEFLGGFGSRDRTPLIATGRLREVIQHHQFGPLFSSAIERLPDRSLPDGEWKATIATRFDRTIYNFTITTTPEDDRRIVDAFNNAANRSHFNLFYDNCSDQTRAVFSIILPPSADIGDRMNGLTMETPKGLAKALVVLAREHPEIELHADRYPQLPGTAPRSREALFPMENVYRNLSFAPYWFFGGFREFAVGAFLYHKLFERFSIANAYDSYATSRSRSVAAGPRDPRANLVRELRATVQDAGRNVDFPADIRSLLLESPSNGRLAEKLLPYFDEHGRFFVDEDHDSPWMTLTLGDANVSTGLSIADIDAGDPRPAFLVLAAALDYELAAPDDRRESLAHTLRLFELLRQDYELLRPSMDTGARKAEPDPGGR